MKLKNVKAGVRVQYKGNKSGHHENVPVGCLGTITHPDGSDRPNVLWDCGYDQYTYIGNMHIVK